MVSEGFDFSVVGFVNNVDNCLIKMDLTNYAKYGISLRTSTNEGIEYYMVTLTFGKKWAVQMPKEQHEQKVMCAKINEDGTYCYMTEVQNGLGIVFSSIDETIQYNEELEKKIELLKVKAEELKELFAAKNYDELTRLKFVIETSQKSSAVKTKRQSSTDKKSHQKSNVEPGGKKNEVQLEPEKETIEDTEPTKTESVSDIDKKIKEAMANKNQ